MRDPITGRAATAADTMLELSHDVVAEPGVVDLVEVLVVRCVEMLDVAAAAILTGTSGGALHVMACSTATARVLELLEVLTVEGPCVDCIHTEAPVSEAALVDASGSELAGVAASAGLRALDAVPMRLQGHVIGVLALLRSEPARTVGADLVAAQAFADLATISMVQHQAAVAGHDESRLNRALQDRIVLEQAKGMVAHGCGLSMIESFGRLRDHARLEHRRITDVALHVVDRTLRPGDLRTGDGTPIDPPVA